LQYIVDVIESINLYDELLPRNAMLARYICHGLCVCLSVCPPEAVFNQNVSTQYHHSAGAT